ncbi:Hypothetical predicted protein [Olea europaea subsp. europaea]|uniref:Uncharacterized protein n=1 Tax=Olea europaea subsp. europaea TaxID=158383 RepID=A0A8S0ULL9_OLEEU|nr:Hypothetical predicted protein [Olea europaea subsp. europaea]
MRVSRAKSRQPGAIVGVLAAQTVSGEQGISGGLEHRPTVVVNFPRPAKHPSDHSTVRDRRGDQSRCRRSDRERNRNPELGLPVRYKALAQAVPLSVGLERGSEWFQTAPFHSGRGPCLEEEEEMTEVCRLK